MADLQNRLGFEDFSDAPIPEYDSEYYAAMASKASYDPYPFLTESVVPMLYLMGGQDVNVPFEASIALLEKLRSRN